MFIHIGNDNVIRSREIVLILDYEVITSSTFMEEMMEKNRQLKKVKQLSPDVKSAIFTEDHIYLSPLTVSTLKKRSSISAMISKLKKYTEVD